MTKKENIIVGKSPSQQKGNQWYLRKGNVLQIEKLKGLELSKAVSYFKTKRVSRGGSHMEEIYWKTLSNGYMIYVDVSKIKMGIALGMPPYNSELIGCTKGEFNTAYRSVHKILSI